MVPSIKLVLFLAAGSDVLRVASSIDVAEKEHHACPLGCGVKVSQCQRGVKVQTMSAGKLLKSVMILPIFHHTGVR